MEVYAILLAKEPDSEDLKSVPFEDRIFDQKLEALKNMKKWKTCNPRMKIFHDKSEALEAAKKIQDDEIQSEAKPETSEGCPYKSLTPQELKRVKEGINANDEELVKNLADLNPRYLMTPCDQPAIIHSGTRANALHIAAQGGKTRMTQVILELITEKNLMERMYPLDSPESISRRQEYLLDLYLNMPKKGDFDTPLHQASKWGHWQVVEILVQYSSCDVNRKNRDNLTPAEVVCSRTGNVDADIKRKILDLLADKVYIPIYRITDNSLPSWVGEPKENLFDSPISSPNDKFAPLVSSSPNNNRLKVPKTPNFQSPMSPQQRRTMDSPLIILGKQGSSPIASPDSMRAYMGPLSPNDADKVKQEWKKTCILRRKDPEKGLEKQGRELAKKYQTSLCEFWPFLQAYCDITSNEGLELLEDFLENQTLNNKVKENENLNMSDIASQLEKLNLNSNKNAFDLKEVEKSLDLNSNPKELGVMKLLEDKNLQPKLSQNPIPSGDEKPNLSNHFIWNQPRRQNRFTSDEDSVDLSQNLAESFSSGSSFESAVESLTESLYSAEEGSWIYIGGDSPDQYDLQVYEALCELDVSKYPRIHTWKCLMETYDDAEKQEWSKTPVKSKKLIIPKLSYDD